MKKRRSNPIPLLSVFILCGALIAWYNNKNAPDTSAQQQQQQQPTNVDNGTTLKPSKAPSKEELQSAVHVGGAGTQTGTGPLMPKGMGPAGGPPGMPPGMPHPPKGPIRPYKPKPSDSSISTQWYTDEANKNVGN